MAKKYVMALDAGTTSNRAIIFDENSKIVGVSQKEFTQYFPQPGWVEHDADEIRSTMCEVMKGALDEKTAILHSANEDGKKMKEQIVTEAREQAETIIENARKEIDRERTQAEKELRDSIVDMTIDAAEKISGKTFTEEDHARLINESISMIKEV